MLTKHIVCVYIVLEESPLLSVSMQIKSRLSIQTVQGVHEQKQYNNMHVHRNAAIATVLKS